MFFIKEKPQKSNAGKIIAISVAVTLGIIAAIYGVYVFCRKYCSLYSCSDDMLDDDFCDCDCDFDDADKIEEETED